MLHNDSTLGGRVPAVSERPSPQRRAPKENSVFILLKEKHKAKVPPAGKAAPPGISFKLDLPLEKALKTHISRLMGCTTRIIPLLLSSGKMLLNNIAHAVVDVPWEPAS